MEVNRSLALEPWCAGNICVEAVCFPLIILADSARSFASFTTTSLLKDNVTLSGPGGVSLALAERERGLSLVDGRKIESAIPRYTPAR